MSTPQFSASALRLIDPVRVDKRIAEKESDVARQETVVEWLRDQLDGEERQLWNMQRGLADLRAAAAQLAQRAHGDLEAHGDEGES
jgi:uncharacterized coiled-coil protein SlyX